MIKKGIDCTYNIFRSENFATEIHVASFPSGNCQPRVLHQSPPQILEHYQTYMLEMFLDARLKCLTIGKHSTTWLTPSGTYINFNKFFGKVGVVYGYFSISFEKSAF